MFLFRFVKLTKRKVGGIWLYGVVTDLGEYYVGVRVLDGTSIVAPPHPQSGLQPITNEELIAAIAQNFIE